jgi:hypothetical protein
MACYRDGFTLLMTTDGSPNLAGENLGLLKGYKILYKKPCLFQYIIQQEVLCKTVFSVYQMAST